MCGIANRRSHVFRFAATQTLQNVRPCCRSFAGFACGLVAVFLPRLHGATFISFRSGCPDVQGANFQNKGVLTPISTRLLRRSRSKFSTPISRCVYYRSVLCYTIILPLISGLFAAAPPLRLSRSVQGIPSEIWLLEARPLFGRKTLPRVGDRPQDYI
jgi:hypothetical protein